MAAGGAAALLLLACGARWDVPIGAQESDASAVSDGSGQLEASSNGSDGAGLDAMESGALEASADGSRGVDAPVEASPSESGAAEDSSADQGAATFNPVTLSGLVLWLDAAQGVTQTTGSVAAWADRTSNHNDAAAPGLALRPTLVASAINGHPAVHFNKDAGGSSTSTGAGDMLSIADAPTLQWGTGDFYVLVVATSDNDLADGAERGVGLLFAKYTSGTNVPGPLMTVNIIGALTTNQVGLGASTSTLTGDSVIAHNRYNDSTPHAFAFQRVGATLDLRVDGVSIATSTSDDADVSEPGANVNIGSSASGQVLRFDGDIAEVMAVRGTLATADRASLESYVLAKYAL